MIFFKQCKQTILHIFFIIKSQLHIKKGWTLDFRYRNQVSYRSDIVAMTKRKNQKTKKYYLKNKNIKGKSKKEILIYMKLINNSF